MAWPNWRSCRRRLDDVVTEVASLHFEHIGDYFAAIGREAPEHPLVATLKVSADALSARPTSFPRGARLSGGFYYLSLKQIVSGQVNYGRTQYDCQTGTVLAMAPGQSMATRDVVIKGEARMLLLHPDYVRGHAAEALLQECGFFHYQVNEALHVSVREQRTMAALFDVLDAELGGGYEASSREIILSHITALLHYCLRYYRRQFLQRSEMQGDWYTRLHQQLEAHYAQSVAPTLPDLQVLSDTLRVSRRYLSDALKAQTGMSAKACVQHYLIEKAKGRLLADAQPVSQVAYALGYSSANYFARVFKKQTGETPGQYRSRMQARH